MTLVFTAFFLGSFAQYPELDRMVEREVKRLVDFDKVPGVIVGVVDGPVKKIYYYGKSGSKQLLDSASVLQIGSLTKVFTASLIESMVKRGELEYETLIENILTARYPSLKGSGITVLDLVIHTTNFPRVPFNIGQQELEQNQPYKHYKEVDFKVFMDTYRFIPQGKKKYSYSHINYALLEAICEEVTGKEFAAILEERILRPLGLKKTGNHLSDDLLPAFQISGRATTPWKFGSFEGALGLHSSPDDLMRLLKFMLNDNEHPLKFMRAMNQPLIKTGIRGVSTCKGWHEVQVRKKIFQFAAHRGTTDGHQSYLAFLDKTDTGVFVLSNSAHSLNNLGNVILQLLNNNWRTNKRLRERLE